MPTNNTRTCCLTPTGRGAIASVVVQGTAGLQAIDQCFRSVSGKLISETAVGQVLFGKWQGPANGSSGEELVVCRIDEETTEVHCHGGIHAPANIIRNLVSLGCEEVDPRDWCHNRQSNITAEAISALANAPTERTALILLEQGRGLLEEEIRTIAELTAEDSKAAGQRISNLLSTSAFGIHLIRPWNVVLAGPPNVGKSSLMNALAGFKRSIVYDQPGTTRDVISLDTALDGWPVRLTDTAGIRDSKSALESEGIELAKRQVNAADLVVMVSDATVATSDNQFAIKPRQLFVRNKCDLLSDIPLTGDAIFYTSAILGIGIEELIAGIVNAIIPLPFSTTSPMVFTDKQKQQLEQAFAQLQNGNCKGAKAALIAML